ncbi:MAG TPA: PHB depolymerase family esterase [Longimicrobiales bacterium]|nr:PHB depolymerase family esterase [Longimicrobiales bacterium]
MCPMTARLRRRAHRCGVGLASAGLTMLLAAEAGATPQAWVQPERSLANLSALARVEVRTHELAQAPGVPIEYGVYVPTGYDAGSPSPLVIALHGVGSGVMYMMEYNNLVELAEGYGFLVATPMGFSRRGWYGSRGPSNDFNRRMADPGPINLGELSELDVMAVLDIMRRDYDVDPDRIYLIGQSMGGGGTWHLGMKYPDVWAALGLLAPAIYTDPDALERARHLPVIVVQGDADQLVDVNVTRTWVAKMQELGMSYEYIEVPDGSHSGAGRENIARVFSFLQRHRRQPLAR